jgi:hypothetical protein
LRKLIDGLLKERCRVDCERSTAGGSDTVLYRYDWNVTFVAVDAKHTDFGAPIRFSADCLQVRTAAPKSESVGPVPVRTLCNFGNSELPEIKMVRGRSSVPGSATKENQPPMVRSSGPHLERA